MSYSIELASGSSDWRQLADEIWMITKVEIWPSRLRSFGSAFGRAASVLSFGRVTAARSELADNPTCPMADIRGRAVRRWFSPSGNSSPIAVLQPMSFRRRASHQNDAAPICVGDHVLLKSGSFEGALRGVVLCGRVDAERRYALGKQRIASQTQVG